MSLTCSGFTLVLVKETRLLLRGLAEASVGCGGQQGGSSGLQGGGGLWALQGCGKPVWRREREEGILGLAGGHLPFLLWCGVSVLKATWTVPPWGGA